MLTPHPPSLEQLVSLSSTSPRVAPPRVDLEQKLQRAGFVSVRDVKKTRGPVELALGGTPWWHAEWAPSALNPNSRKRNSKTTPADLPPFFSHTPPATLNSRTLGPNSQP